MRTVNGLVTCILVKHMPGKVGTMGTHIEFIFMKALHYGLKQISQMTQARIMVLKLLKSGEVIINASIGAIERLLMRTLTSKTAHGITKKEEVSKHCKTLAMLYPQSILKEIFDTIHLSSARPS